ncbi:CocE/NonD family hydrolase [Brevibacterium moorei]|uniref:CocE/NonD family hydrolase n=1 Tax=Brevibacterium moorei TaxID=2968457 RepID=UPI00211C9147|nr:CocE/NonD family hydrolase [Brevibacterium sp. 68QC2CO]MCQ9385401.1 CocE/NonD family hydrolase [Brevibacterium sp. 68QC2CO]
MTEPTPEPMTPAQQTSTDSFRYRSDPLPVHVIENARIPLADGVELSARVWLPADRHTQLDATQTSGDRGDAGTQGFEPVPAVLEYIPYRKNDMTAARDQTIHPEFARAGYASVRVDLRGCGDSTGVMTDEYSATELDDGLQTLAWIAAQPWCNGKVGIIGKSWGGFNGLQLAALRPPELAAVITVCSTDDRYADDVHYNGGAIVGDQMLSWASTMWAYNARPQDPAVAGAGWLEDWKHRIDESPNNIAEWLGHQRRDAYWKHASVCETPEAIEVPVLAVGGLQDEYRTTLFRLMENAAEQRRTNPDYPPIHALLGGHAHNYPHQAAPGPGYDFIGEAIRWWDKWMKGMDNGVQDDPQLRAFVPDSAPIGSDRETRPGRWVAEQVWPSPQVAEVEYGTAAPTGSATPAALTATPAGPRTLSSSVLLGFDGGSWLQFGEAAGIPGDQARDDAQSFTLSWPAAEGLEILGTPRVRATVSSSADRGVIAARLCDVDPAGQSRLLTLGLFNLTHHTGHEFPEPLTPGTPVELDFPLLATAARLAPGHSLRLSISASYWPNLWPSPGETLITVHDANLLAPVRTAADPVADSALSARVTAALGTPPEPPENTIDADYAPMTRTLETDLVTGRTKVETFTESWQTDLADGLFYYSSERDSYFRTAGDSSSPEAVCERSIRYRRPGLPDVQEAPGRAHTAQADAPAAADHGWDVELRTRSRMTGDATSFTVTNELVAYHDGVPFHRRRTNTTVPRDLN